MLPVYLTVDVEVSCPLAPGWRENGLAREIERDIYGRTRRGDFGLGYQIDTLEAHDLRANFFVETLSSQAGGESGLRGIVERLRGTRQDLQLHLHVEWLERMLPPRTGPSRFDLGSYSEEDQTQLIAEAIRCLEACGGRRPNAFRAGNFAANTATLRALARNGIQFDTSQNFCRAVSFPERRGLGLPPAHWEAEGVHEFPVSIFSDWPGHWRPAQVCACSSAELEHALETAHRYHWPAFVIVWHSFELTKRLEGRPDTLVLSRFRRLCQFLADRTDKFETRVFSETAAPVARPRAKAVESKRIYSKPWSTAYRMGQQMATRLL